MLFNRRKYFVLVKNGVTGRAFALMSTQFPNETQAKSWCHAVNIALSTLDPANQVTFEHQEMR